MDAETLSDVFDGMIPEESLSTELPEPPVAIDMNATKIGEIDVTRDSDFSRRSVESLLSKSQQLLEIALASASDNPSPRGIEAACMALSTVSDVAKKLVELNEKIMNVQNGKTVDAGSNNTFINNTNPKIYLTTAELLASLKEDAEKAKSEA